MVRQGGGLQQKIVRRRAARSTKMARSQGAKEGPGGGAMLGGIGKAEDWRAGGDGAQER